MQANWSLILNVLLLIGVVLAIGRLMKSRRQNDVSASYRPSLSVATDNRAFDEIIAVRKVTSIAENENEESASVVVKPALVKTQELQEEPVKPKPQEVVRSIMIFLLAKENRQLAGYELLQTVLAAGLRFGEGQLFHRHQYSNGQGPILCSLAAATATGMFDLQNIGAFNVRGLCLFMEASGNSTVDTERFNVMLDTAKQLSDGLDAHLLDEQKQVLSETGVARYRQLLNIA